MTMPKRDAQRATLEIGNESRDGISVTDEIDGTRQIGRHRNDACTGERSCKVAIPQTIAREPMREHGNANRIELPRPIDIDVDVFAAERRRLRHHGKRRWLSRADACGDCQRRKRGDVKPFHVL